MFTINVEEVFQISNRKGITLVGKTSGVVKIGDYLIDVSDRTKSYKVIGIEMLHFTNIDKAINYNPAIMIALNTTEPSELKGKTLESL